MRRKASLDASRLSSGQFWWFKAPQVISYALIILLLPTVSFARDGISLKVEPSYFSGTYGTGKQNSIYYLPFTAAYERNNVKISITIPYMELRGQTLVSNGQVIGSGSSAVSHAGLGDVIIKGKYYASQQFGVVPGVSPYFVLVIPTGSRKNGLGTGEFSEEPGSVLHWRLGRRFFSFVKLGYRFSASPAGQKFRNVPIVTAGVTGVISPGHYLTAVFAGHPAIQAKFPNSADILLAYDTSFMKRYDLQFFIDKGLTAGSANIGGGMGVSTHF
ncbi:MAG: hypothetical protein B7Z75_02190 [Acidocella sp. 20-57-95]|nr:MAG: hypothetical protein B7Z75_02190 [Acidocella sp. 20-57-95]